MAEDLDTQETAGLPDFLRDPVGLLFRRWRWMLVALLAGFAGTAAFVVSVEPRYVANAMLLVTSQQVPKNLVTTTLEDDPLGEISAMTGAVLSRETLSRVIEKYDLYPTEQNTLARVDLIAEMRENITIQEEKGTGAKRRDTTTHLFTISYEADEPEIAAKVANEIAGRLVNESIRMRTQQARLMTQFLRLELEAAESELRAQNRLITEFKQRNRGELPGELSTNLNSLDRLQLQRQSLALQIAEAETRMLTLASPGSVKSLPDDASPAERLLALRAELAQQLAVNTGSHPDVIALNRQIAALEQEIPETLGGQPGAPPSRDSLLTGSQRTLVELKAQLAATEVRLAELDARVARTPSRQEELAALEESETVLRESYLSFLRKVQEAELSESLESAQQGGHVSIVDVALPPSNPEQNRLKFLAAGVAASFVLSLGVGALLESRDPVLVTPEQLESAAGLPILGSTPRIS